MHAVADMLVQGFLNLHDKHEYDGDLQADANVTAAERARRRQVRSAFYVTQQPCRALCMSPLDPAALYV